MSESTAPVHGPRLLALSMRASLAEIAATSVSEREGKVGTAGSVRDLVTRAGAAADDAR